jgi:hypothetical protein
MATCKLCGQECDDGTTVIHDGLYIGETCDDCAAVLISGSPAEIDALLGRVPCKECGGYNCECGSVPCPDCGGYRCMCGF